MILLFLLLLIAQASAEDFKVYGVKCTKGNLKINFVDLEFYLRHSPSQISRSYQIKLNRSKGNYYDWVTIDPKAEVHPHSSDNSYVEKLLQLWSDKVTFVEIVQSNSERLMVESYSGYSKTFDYVHMTTLSTLRHSEDKALENHTDGHLARWYSFFGATHLFDRRCNYRSFRYGVDKFFLLDHIYLYDYYKHVEIDYTRLGTVGSYFHTIDSIQPMFIFMNNINDLDEPESVIIYKNSEVTIGSASEALFFRESDLTDRKPIKFERKE